MKANRQDEKMIPEDLVIDLLTAYRLNQGDNSLSMEDAKKEWPNRVM